MQTTSVHVCVLKSLRFERCDFRHSSTLSIKMSTAEAFAVPLRVLSQKDMTGDYLTNE